MSHTTSVKSVKITDIEALKKAVQNLAEQGRQVTLVENAVPRMYYKDQHGKCDYVLKLGGIYDVGLEKQKDGSYVPVFDEWGGHVANVLGTKKKVPAGTNKAEVAIGALMSEYALEATRNYAYSQGLLIDSIFEDEQGNVQVVLQGY